MPDTAGAQTQVTSVRWPQPKDEDRCTGCGVLLWEFRSGDPSRDGDAPGVSWVLLESLDDTRRDLFCASTDAAALRIELPDPLRPPPGAFGSGRRGSNDLGFVSSPKCLGAPSNTLCGHCGNFLVYVFSWMARRHCKVGR
mmetsp:Transcript_95336/g.204618  ORF Transcript_95336/g.204618 Transcript_95336/m.204618 type:complete len:140 (-) Transcript_95336:2770-3189(-)